MVLASAFSNPVEAGRRRGTDRGSGGGADGDGDAGPTFRSADAADDVAAARPDEAGSGPSISSSIGTSGGSSTSRKRLASTRSAPLPCAVRDDEVAARAKLRGCGCCCCARGASGARRGSTLPHALASYCCVASAGKQCCRPFSTPERAGQAADDAADCRSLETTR